MSIKSKKIEKDQLSYYLRKASQYEPLDQDVGEGSFGTVILVRDTNTDKIYAKKNVPFPPDDEDAPKYFFREFLSLRDFQIDGLPFLKLEGFNFPVKDEEAFIITEYIENGSLSKLIRNKFKKCEDVPTTKMILIYGIAYAIKILHKNKVVHRDLKPENILLSDKYEPILADFGFARLISDKNITVTGKLGTLMYMAPELIVNSEIEPDFSIDVYSFAVLIFQIIYGPLLFDGKSPFVQRNERLFIKHVKKGGRFDLPGPEILPENFKRLITECWSQEPSERWPMKKIVKALKNGEFVLDGCDMDKFTEYVERLDKIYADSKKEEPEEEVIEYTKPYDF